MVRKPLRRVTAAASVDLSGIEAGCLHKPESAVRNAASRQSFKEQEGLVNQQLAQLIRDGVWLKSYLAAVMRLEAEAFQQASGGK